MEPALELVQIRQGESFKAWEHGYPFHTVRWHFHPEYEIHHVVATSGHLFVGDHIGSFEPGQLVLTGPNLPHNWVSVVPDGTEVPVRGRIVQFSDAFIAGATAAIPELGGCARLLQASTRGLLFSPATARSVAPMLEALTRSHGIRRVELFVGILALLSQAHGVQAQGVQTLTSAGYLPDPSGFMSEGINAALAFINDHLTEPFTETELAALAGRSPSAFSRSFSRHTGMTLVQYVNRLRINLACQLLMNGARPGAGLPITEICYAAGYNNLSNFNRQFLLQKGMPPSRFRALLAERAHGAQAA